MSRLPDLEQALLNAARTLESDGLQVDPQTEATERRHARRRRRRGTPMLVAVVGLLSAGGAVAAVSGLLGEGDPVPPAPRPFLKPTSPAAGFALADVRVADPDGGPPWGLGTYSATSSIRPTSSASSGRERVACVVVGRVQAGKLGVVGRDGVFQNDGRFHPLAPASQASGVCGGIARNGSFQSISLGPPIPASGYTGAPGTRIGGCRERVNLDGPTVSPQTRRKLKNVPQCSKSGLRQVISGYAGPGVRNAKLTAEGIRKTQALDPEQNGAYLFVYRPTSSTPPRLQFTDRAGHTCDAFLQRNVRNPATRAKLCR